MPFGWLLIGFFLWQAGIIWAVLRIGEALYLRNWKQAFYTAGIWSTIYLFPIVVYVCYIIPFFPAWIP